VVYLDKSFCSGDILRYLQRIGQAEVGALGLTLRALFEPKAKRKTLSDHLTRIRRRWFERKLPKLKTPHDYP